MFLLTSLPEINIIENPLKMPKCVIIHPFLSQSLYLEIQGTTEVQILAKQHLNIPKNN